MTSGRDLEAILSEARRHHLDRVNQVVRRPGTYGRDETAERLLLEAMAALDGSLARWSAELDGLRKRDAFVSTGVVGAYGNILPAEGLRDATASVYAEIAHRVGWLELDRALTEAELSQIRTDLDAWLTEDRRLTDVLETFGPPSVWIGGTNPYYSKTLVYASTDPQHGMICFHLWNARAGSERSTELRGVHAEPMVLAVRHRPGKFPESFSFTPEGILRRPTDAQVRRLRPTVWIFHGDRAQFASGVFDTEQAGLAWATEHRLTGILTEYEIGGAYDIAVLEGRFTPSKPHHGTAQHVAAFGPGLQHIHLTDGRRA